MNLIAEPQTEFSSAVYGVDLLPEGPVSDALPAYGGVEMVAGQLRWMWCNGERIKVRVPVHDPAIYWDVAVRVSPTVPRHELVSMLLALAGAIEAGRMPDPIEAAQHPLGHIITVGSDPSASIERE
jgi:hypothetical protein